MSLLLLGTLFALVFAMLFNLSEAGAIASDRLALSVRARKGDKRAQLLTHLLEPPSNLILTTLIGVDLALVLASTFFSRYAVEVFTPNYRELASTIGLTLVFFIFGELLPKSAGISSPNNISLALVRLVRIVAIPLQPLVIFVQWITRHVLGWMGMKGHDRSRVINRDEIVLMFADSRHTRLVPPNERSMIESIMNLDETKVSEVMTPLVQIFELDARTTVRDAIKALAGSKARLIPVYKERTDKIIGVVTVNDLLGAPLYSWLENLVHPLPVVPENGYLEYALPLLKDSPDLVAEVVDEFGGLSGFIFLDDIFEHLIHQESGMDEIKLVKGGTQTELDVLLPAQTSITDAEEALRTTLPDGAYVTLGGMMVSMLGYMPGVGETLQVGDYEFVVAHATPRMITSVRIHRIEPEKSEGEKE
jgi:CBS domain containing-hemolysin-like protein